MTAALYDTGRNAFAKGQIAWKASGGSTIRAFLVTSGYTPDLTNDQFLSAVPTSARAGNSGQSTRSSAPQLTLLDPSAGICDANDISFNSVPPGSIFTALILFVDDGVSDASSQLIAYIANSVGEPILSNGADILMVFANTGNKIFKL